LTLLRHRRIVAIAGLCLSAAFVYRPLLEGRSLAGRDAFRLFIPDTAFLLECVSRGEWPLWSPFQRLGQPFLATLYSQVFYPPRLLAALLGGRVWAIGLEQLFHALIAALGTFLACRKLGLRFLASSLGAFAFAFAPLFTQLAVQQNVASAAAWTGFLVAGALALGRRPGILSALALGAVAALSFLAGSPETLLWQLALVAAVLGFGPRPAKAAGAGALGLSWGAALAGVVLLPALELARESGRLSGAPAPLTWSMPWTSLASMAWLNLDLPRPEYVGREQNFVHDLFQGSLISALAAWACLRRPRRRPLAGIALAGLGFALLSTGEHFPPAAFLLSHRPLSMFRYPAKYVVGAAFALSVLSAAGLDRAAAWARKRPRARTAALLGLAGGAGLAVAAVPLARALGLRAGAGSGLAWAAAFLGLAAFAASWFKAAPARPVSVFALALVELLLASGLNGMEAWLPAAMVRGGPGLAEEVARPQAGRLSTRLSDERAIREGIAYVARSFEALVPLRFVEAGLKAVEGYGAPELTLVDEILDGAPRRTFDLFGVTDYLRDGDAPPFEGLKLVSRRPGLPAHWSSDDGFPRAFVVHRAERVSDEAAFRALREPDAPTRDVALLATGGPLRAAESCLSPSSAAIVEDGFSAVKVAVDACAEGYLILADRFFPGWEAAVDGIPSPIERADLVLRAVRVGPGKHEVAFTYRPSSFRRGGILSGAAALLGLGLALAAWRRGAGISDRRIRHMRRLD
jgi:hypothetical protein